MLIRLIRKIKHSRITFKLCPVCKKRIAWRHIPYLDGVTFSNHSGMLTCWKCFYSIWSGEN